MNLAAWRMRAFVAFTVVVSVLCGKAIVQASASAKERPDAQTTALVSGTAGAQAPEQSVGQAVTPDMKEGRLLRFPDIYKGKIAFSYAGDLWLVASEGGVARRITTNPGLELFPKFSPDGSHIAFTGQYDGNNNVYVIPSEGGEPKQLTFQPAPIDLPERMGPENEVITWMPDGKRVLFLSRRETFQFLVRAPLLDFHGWRNAGAAATGQGRDDVVFSRWARDRVQQDFSKLSNVEALHGRHGAENFALRFPDESLRAD